VRRQLSRSVVDRDQPYVYRGDRMTAPELRGVRCYAVRMLNIWSPRPSAGLGPVCIRGRNGNMLVETEDGRRVVVLGRQLRKVIR
jgi:hypothetical protein